MRWIYLLSVFKQWKSFYLIANKYNSQISEALVISYLNKPFFLYINVDGDEKSLTDILFWYWNNNDFGYILYKNEFINTAPTKIQCTFTGMGY